MLSKPKVIYQAIYLMLQQTLQMLKKKKKCIWLGKLEYNVNQNK